MSNSIDSSTDGSEQGGAETASPEPNKGFLIVGLGGSAGALTAFKEFFQNVPPQSGMAYVVILHLSPNYDSHLAEILQQSTEMPVAQVREAVRVEPNRVYVIPPDKSLSMQDGLLMVSDRAGYEERRAPVDIFFRTLAEANESRAVSVIVSGTGANGSMGLKRIKERGGLVLAQAPSEAEFDEMPRNSIATGFVDHVLPVADIPGKIVAYRDQLGSIHIPTDADEQAEADERALIEIFTHLRVRTGHDFTNYKRASVLRRIERRLAVLQLADLSAYARYIREHREEAHTLLKDLLISVTNFFRDREAFWVLEQKVIPSLFEGRGAQDQVRVWVAGCATGEEAYSVAILLAERAAGLAFAPNVQVFATDLDEQAVAQARNGYYTLNDVADVPPERLRQFFIKEGNGFRVRRELREMVLFAQHNLIKDPPFSHLDLITCRNVLIYLNRKAQERALEMLHFALNPGGYLMLGTSESVDGSSDLFTATFDKESHLYQSRAVMARLSVPSVEPLPAWRVGTGAAPEPTSPRVAEKPTSERFSALDLHQRLLEFYGPPSVLVNEEYEIIHASDRAGRYLHFPGGEPSRNLLRVVRPELGLELRAALLQAAQNQTSVEARGLVVVTGDGPESVNILVRPALGEGDPARGFFLVLFEESREADAVGKEPAGEIVNKAEPAARRVAEENARLRAQMRATVEQYEVQAEELRAANEEQQAVNEELRSTSEELETSKEELQAVNEELHTVNQELKIKIEELSQANDDLRNLMTSSEIGAIFLDRALRIKLFTPRAREIFNLIPADVGRPLSHVTSQFTHDGLLAEAESVLERLHTVEREVETRAGRWYLMRLLPYRTAEDRIEGVVLTFVDITERKRAEEALQRAHDELEGRVRERTKELAEANAALQDEVRDRRAAEQRVSNLLRQLVNAQEDERRRIARDLHDHLGQQLTALRLNLTLIDQAGPDDDWRARVAQAQSVAEELDKDVDFLAWQLRPAAFDRYGLEAALGYFVQDWTKYTGIHAELHTTGLNGVRLAPDIEISLYRILQEALNNIAKHAEAANVSVLLERQGAEVRLIVEDDGRGFASEEQTDSGTRTGGLGMTGIRERAQLAGGKAEIESSPGAGTTVLVRVPVTRIDDRDASG